MFDVISVTWKGIEAAAQSLSLSRCLDGKVLVCIETWFSSNDTIDLPSSLVIQRQLVLMPFVDAAPI